MRRTFFALLILLLLPATAGAAGLPYARTMDHVFLTKDGVDFHMDIFVPNGENRKAVWKPGDTGQGLAIVDIGSGGWSADRGKLNDHETAQVYNILCARGYTVFAVLPGSRPDYTALEMVDHVEYAIRWVKAHAEDYGIDPDRIGLTGASAGGHLACLTAARMDSGDPDAADPVLRESSTVQAVGIFFPPTDFLNWEGKDFAGVRQLIGDILIAGGAEGHSEDALRAAAKAASPIYNIKPNMPPFMIYHGDADPIVPLQQSVTYVEAMKAAGNEIALEIKPGGAHPWIDIPFEVIKLTDWFDAKLAN